MSMQQPTLAELRPGVREFRSEGTHRMIRADNGMSAPASPEG